MQAACCQNCVAYEPLKGGNKDGECRLVPPVYCGDDDGVPCFYFPDVFKNEWCRQFQSTDDE
jgi:hypothetical protein